jgi:hypothetical protein
LTEEISALQASITENFEKVKDSEAQVESLEAEMEEFANHRDSKLQQVQVRYSILKHVGLFIWSQMYFVIETSGSCPRKCWKTSREGSMAQRRISNVRARVG